MSFFAVDIENLIKMEHSGFTLLEFPSSDEDTYELIETPGTKLISFTREFANDMDSKGLYLRPRTYYRLDDIMIGGNENIYIFTDKNKALDFIRGYLKRVWNFYNAEKAKAEAKMAELTYLASGY